MEQKEEKIQVVNEAQNEVQQEANEQEEEEAKEQIVVKAQEKATTEKANKDAAGDAPKEVKEGDLIEASFKYKKKIASNKEVEATEAVEETNGGEEAAEVTEEAETNGDATSGASKEVKEGDLINASTDNDLKLFVGGLAKGTEESHLEEYFSAFGTVVATNVMKRGNKKSGKPMGYGFVLFDDKKVVEKVLRAESHEVNGGTVGVEMCIKREGNLRVEGIESIEDDGVKTYFENFGKIYTYRRRIDKTSNTSNVCIISFKDDSSFERCLREKHEINGRTVKVRKCRKDPMNPSKETEMRGRKVAAVKYTMIKGQEVPVGKTEESKVQSSSKKVFQKIKQNTVNGQRFNVQTNNNYWPISDYHGKPYINDRGYGDHQGYNQNYGYQGGYGYQGNYSNPTVHGYQGGYEGNDYQGGYGGYGYQGGYGGYGYQQYGGYGDHYQGYVYDQGYGNFQGNQGGYRGYQQQGGFQRGGFRGRNSGGFGKAQVGRGSHQNRNQLN